MNRGILYTCLAGAVVVAVAPLAAQSIAPDNPSSKLATVLASLASAVPQDEGRALAERAPGGPRLSADVLPKPVQDAIRSRRLRLDDANAAQVYILMSSVTDETVARLAAAGATIEIRDAARRRVQARVPARRLQAVASLPFVDFVRLPTYARHRIGLVTTEGDHILHADAARQQLSVDGTGVRVGVISDGLKGLFATGCTTCGGVGGGPIATGDLPDAVGVRNARGLLISSSGGVSGRSFQDNGDLEGLPPGECAFDGAGAEGTAILEIVHDIAPGAQLSFANPDTDLAFAQAVDYLASTNDIVMDDLGFFGEPFDGTSVVAAGTATSLNNPSYPIRAYFTAVGNEADEHYYGTYVDSHIDGSQILGAGAPAGDLHLFQQSADTTDVLGLGAQPYNLISLPNGGEVVIFLSWDDPFGGSANNYDLYLVNQTTGRVVARSIDAQRGAQDPVEFIDYVNDGASAPFRIVVQNVRNAAAPRHLNLYSFEPECAADGPRILAPLHHERHNYNTATFSVAAQGDAGGTPVAAVSVGAICSAAAATGAFFRTNPNESCNDTTNSTLEFFSSRGPTLDGRPKPDVSAIDGVSVTGAGGFVTTFFGTSAATPHVAGIAALTLQAAPCLLASAGGRVDPTAARTKIRSLMVDTATALPAAGAPDGSGGAGRVDAGSAIQRTLPVFGGPAAITVDATTDAGAMLSAAQIGFSDPNGCQLTTLSWTGGCGTGPGPALSCPRGTNRVSVAASNNGVAFSAPVDLQITVR
jgi:subtilase family protein